MSDDWPWARDFAPDGIYLGTATCGIPPRVTLEAMASVTADWARGRVAGPDFDPVVDEARKLYARLVGVETSAVAIGHQVSPMAGLIAAALPDGTEILVAENEFTSVTFPFAVHAGRGVRVREVPLEALASEVRAETALVAVSAVQSADGRIADLDAIAEATDRHGADVLVDLTQATGWLPVKAGRFAYTVCGAYKWLMAPRGTAFMTVRPDRLDRLTPLTASWYGGEPQRQAATARRHDVSPAWFSWVGTRASLAYLADIGLEQVHRHDLTAEAAFARAAGLSPGPSAIRSLVADDAVSGIMRRLDATASVRAGRLRLAFHVHNTVEEADRLGRALRGHVTD